MLGRVSGSDQAVVSRSPTSRAGVQNELSEERVQLVVLDQRLVKEAQLLEDKRQLLLQREVVAEAPVRGGALLTCPAQADVLIQVR